MNSPIHQIANSPIARLIDREGLSAAAGRRRLGILDREPAAGDRVNEIDFGPIQVSDADRVDEQLDAVLLEHLIA